MVKIMNEKNQQMQKLYGRSTIFMDARKFYTGMGSIQTVMKSPLDRISAETRCSLSKFREQMAHFKDPLKEFREQMAHFKDPLKEFREQMAHFKDPLKEFREQMAHFKDPLKELRKYTFNSSIKGLRVSSTSVFNGSRIKMEPFNNSSVNNTSNLEESIKPATTSISVPVICDDILIEPEQEEITQSNRISNLTDTTHTDCKKVFIVCRKDEEAKQTVARFIEELGLEVIIIDEQPSGAKTRIEMLETYSEDVGFTVVLLTPDSIDKSKTGLTKCNSRSSQDVILQLGFMMGKHGRNQICFLSRGEFDLPPSLDGVNPVMMDYNNGWKFDLLQEMKISGMFFDTNEK